ESAPGRRKSDLISVRVLDDEPFKNRRRLGHDTKAYRSTVILHEQAEAIESLLEQEILRNLGKVIESVAELFWVWRIAIAKPWVVWRDHMESVCQRRDEVSVLMRRRRESVKKDQLRISGFTGLTIGDLQAADFFYCVLHIRGSDFRAVLGIHCVSFLLTG